MLRRLVIDKLVIILYWAICIICMHLLDCYPSGLGFEVFDEANPTSFITKI